MNNVHALKLAPQSPANTVRISRKKPARIRCSGCGRRNDCNCLCQLQLIARMAPLVRELLAGRGPERRIDAVRAELARLVARDEQRLREMHGWSGVKDPDRMMLEELVLEWGYEPIFNRSIPAVAARHRVPVERVQTLFDRFMAATEGRAV